MNQQNEKSNGCVLFRSVVEAAEELDQAAALELLLTYAHIGLGDEVDLNKCSKTVRLILKQNVASLEAAQRRYEAACKNGPKGGEAGKEKGGGVGRPRKGETTEDYKKRVEEWKSSKTPSKTPEKPPVNTNQKPPENPLEKEIEYEKDKEKEIYIDKEIDKYKNLSWEEYLKLFVNKYPTINYDLDFSVFTSTYRDILEKYQKFIYENTGESYSIDFLTFHLTYYAVHGRVWQREEKTITA